MMIAFRSDWGRAALAARSFSNEGQESVAIPVRPICMKLRRSSGPEQRKGEGCVDMAGGAVIGGERSGGVVEWW